MARLRRHRGLIHHHNTLDYTVLEPGDLVLVANPSDPWPIQALMFWSHVAIYVGESEERAFVDAVNLPIRRAGRRTGRGLPWQRVRYTGLRMFRSYADVLVLRPRLPASARRAAAEFAASQVGKPFSRSLVAGLLRPRGRTPSGSAEFTCASLVWTAYYRQGLDLCSGPLGRLVLPWPSRLGHDRRLAHVARGTRFQPVRAGRGPLRLWLTRAWARWALRSDILWQGCPAPGPGPAGPPEPPASPDSPSS